MLRRVGSTAIALIVFFCAVQFIAPSRADAHGLGGLEPTPTRSKIKRVTPATDKFTIESIENGARVRITRTSSSTIYVLGTENELYIRINDKGTYLNQKSVTRVINKTTNGQLSNDELDNEFKQTSDDPHVRPIWVKATTSQSYAFHDHRAHYMGSLRYGLGSIGTNTLKIKVDQKTYTATFEFEGGKRPATWLWLSLFIVSFGACIGWFIFRRTKFSELFSQPVVMALIGLIFVGELIHLMGYLAFSQQSIGREFSASLYGIIACFMCLVSLLRIVQLRKKQWKNSLSNIAPILALTGFAGVIVGPLLEYRTYTEPYLATEIAPVLARIVIYFVGVTSLVIGLLGTSNIASHAE
jgi:hypothetical protein